MIGITEMQFGGMLTMVLLALTVAFQVPRRSMRNKIFAKARWMMAAGLALIASQFLLQYIGGYRQMGVTQAVFWNLLFFMPCSISINMAILFVQQKGHIDKKNVWGGVAMYLMTVALLFGVALTDDTPFEQESALLRAAEYVGATLFLITQSYYFVLLYKGYRRMQRAVDEYYDHERNDLLGWMGRSVTMLAFITMFVPFAIFQEGWLLTVFACAFFIIIYYCASCFHSYGISQDLQRVEEAELSQENDETEPVISEVDRLRVEQAAQKWVDQGGYLKPNQTLTTVANDMDVQRYMLKAWLQQTEYGKLTNWLSRLRTDEARRVMTEHPDWGIEFVAEHCGLSLSSFHRVFHQYSGMTPAKFQQAMKYGK